MQDMPWGRADVAREVGEFKQKMYRSVLTTLERYCPPPAGLLDTGCSFGGFLTEARKAGYDVAGCDIIPEAIKYVRSLGIPAEVSVSIGDVKVDDNSVDVLTCLDVNYYWPNQFSELQYAFAKLRRGGYLVMRVADKSWMCAFGLTIQRLAPTMGKKILLAALNDHRFSMPVPSLLKVIQSAGFEVVYASVHGAIPSNQSQWIVKLSSLLGSIMWATTGVFIAPGALVLAKKPANNFTERVPPS